MKTENPEPRTLTRRLNVARDAWQEFLLLTHIEPGSLVAEDLCVRLIFSAPGIRVTLGSNGYIVDREIPVGVDLQATGEYAVKHTRELLSRELALHRILETVIPYEFIDLTAPLLEQLEQPPGSPSLRLGKKPKT